MAENKTDSRIIGAVVPVAALRGKDSVGCGEFLDLVEAAALCKELHLGVLQILPVNDTGYESSPYFTLTAFALNPIYIKLSALGEAKKFAAKINEARERFETFERFPYRDVLRAKIDILREIFLENKAEIEKCAELKSWITQNGWVKTYAVFRGLKEKNDLKSWKDWSEHGSADKKEIETLWKDGGLKDENLFWTWVQFKLDLQFCEAARALSSLGIILEGDLPILINEDSADVWAHGEYFDSAFSAGAPPDMYSPHGQNWGFPIYNWAAHEKDGFAWWKARLKSAEKYFGAYRIDHALGFFRIWASSKANISARLGRLIPSVPIKKEELAALGFDEGRLRWLSLPHIPTGEVYNAVRGAGGGDADAVYAIQAALERIGSEELWLFKNHIHGEKDIATLEIHYGAKEYLINAWNDRLLQDISDEKSSGIYSLLWNYRDSRAFNSLSSDEKALLDDFIVKKNSENEKKWEVEGKKLLGMLKESSSMLPCAEDLGAMPSCVPKVLSKLNILGLRVIRWTRKWDAEGQPYIPFAEYPELSVCTASVHDSSTLREWWEKEADQNDFAAFLGAPNLPKPYNPGLARLILKNACTAASRWRVFQIQDLLHLSSRWYLADSANERINVPGESNDFNWTYRLPAAISEIAKDAELVERVRELAAVPAAVKAKKAKRS